MSYHLSHQITMPYDPTIPLSKSVQKINAWEGVEKMEPPYTVEKNVSWGIQYMKTAWSFLKKLKFELPYDPTIPLLGIYENSK